VRYSKSEVETEVTALKLETDVSAPELEAHTTALELEMEMDVSQEKSKQERYLPE
jgi:hypothetical protein